MPSDKEVEAAAQSAVQFVDSKIKSRHKDPESVLDGFKQIMTVALEAAEKVRNEENKDNVS